MNKRIETKMGSGDQTPVAGVGEVRSGTELNGIYRIDRRLGVGGMGEVFRGHNIQTNDVVAIKIILPQFAESDLIVGLFRKEASILNHLSHDAIVQYHVFTMDPGIGRLYLAMEFVEGESLAARAAREPLSFAETVIVGARLASGLHTAHRAGIVHRDLSPDNIILKDHRVDHAKIIDFGIAKSAEIGGTTLIGSAFAGKIDYASPEQLGLYGGEVSPKSDIYSLGLVIAAAMTGAPLNMSGSQADMIRKRLVVPDLSLIDPTIEPILSAMLQPSPAKRLDSMAEVVELFSKLDFSETSPTMDPQAVAHQLESRMASQILPEPASSATPAIESMAMETTGAKSDLPRASSIEIDRSRADSASGPDPAGVKAPPSSRAISHDRQDANPDQPDRFAIGAVHGGEKREYHSAANRKPFKVMVLLLAFVAIVGAAYYSLFVFRGGDEFEDLQVFKDCGDCPEMVVVPPGQYDLKDAHAKKNEEQKSKTIHIAYRFAIGRTEVTNRQFAYFLSDLVRSGDFDQRLAKTTFDDPTSHLLFRVRSVNVETGYENQPIVHVTWKGAVSYAQWLSKKTGRTYRLPSQTEWEHTARGGVNEDLFFGDDLKQLCRYANTPDVSAARVRRTSYVKCDDGYSGLAPVGKLAANPYGLKDVLGNVWEWTLDCFDRTISRIPEDGRPVVQAGLCSERVVRGGAFDFFHHHVSALYRHSEYDSSKAIGFRVARELEF